MFIPHPIATKRLILYPLTLRQYYLFIFRTQDLAKELDCTYAGQEITGPFSAALKKRYLNFLAARQQPFFYTLWLIADPAAKVIAGNLGFKGFDPLNGSTEIGYGLGVRYRGCGYMTEAVTALTDFALTLPALYRITAVTQHDNMKSVAVLQKSNFFYTYKDDFYLHWTKSTK